MLEENVTGSVPSAHLAVETDAWNLNLINVANAGEIEKVATVCNPVKNW